MDRGHEIMRMVEGPVVEAADPFDPESCTAELPPPGVPAPAEVPSVEDDPLVPPVRSGARGWFGRVRGVLRRCGAALIPVALLAAVPMHFFVGRVDDTVVAAPALFDMAGGFGLLLLPVMWLAYFAVSALPLVLCLAGVVAVAVSQAAVGALPRPGVAWRLVSQRLRPLWSWFALFGLVTQALPLLLTADRLGAAVAVPLALVLALVSTAVLTLTGVLGCVVLVERRRGVRRALYLCSVEPPYGLVGAALAVTVLPRLADAAWGAYASTAVAVVAALVWAVAAVVAYAQGRRAEGPVTSASLRAELAAEEIE